MSFRTKTILGIALIELVLLAVLVGNALAILRDSNEKELVRRVQLGGGMIAAAAKDAVISQDLATLDSLAEEVVGSGQADYVRILDAAGNVLSQRGTPALLARPFRKDSGIGQVDDQVFDWASPILAGGGEYGSVALGVSTEPLSRLLASTRRWAAGIAGLEMLLVALFSWLLGSYLLRQLVALRDASGRLASGEFGHRVPVKGHDELAQTARAFNRMAERLEEINRGLERLVAARTEELKTANDRLREEGRERERNLRKVESLLQRNHILMMASMDGIHVLDMEGNLVEANDAFYRMLGYSREETGRLNVADWDARWPIEDLRHRFEELVGGRIMVETQHRRRDGSVVDMEIGCAGVEIEGQRYIFAVSRDITARKKAENDLRIAAATFETHDPILITDAQARIICVNRAFTEVTGYAREEVLGRNPNIMASGRHDKAFFAAMWKQLLETGTWVGEIWDRRKGGQVFPKWMTITAVRNEKDEITHYVAIFSDITARKEADEAVQNLAFYDALTQLPNRRLFLDRFRQVLLASERHGGCGAVLFLDMDRFKALNDTYGHDQGDLMLIEVASRLKSCIRESDTAARLGGDEFVVLIENIGNALEQASAKVGLVANKIHETLACPYLIKGCEHHSTPSIGVCLFRGTPVSVETLLQHADRAMYRAKDAGGDRVCFYDPSLERE